MKGEVSMLKVKRKINIMHLATFLLTVVSPALINVRTCAAWVGEPQLPKKVKS